MHLRVSAGVPFAETGRTFATGLSIASLQTFCWMPDLARCMKSRVRGTVKFRFIARTNRIAEAWWHEARMVQFKDMSKISCLLRLVACTRCGV